MSTADELRQALAALSLDTRGHKKVLSRRLAKAKSASAPKTPEAPSTRPWAEEFDSFLVCDVEGTCERIEGESARLAFSYPNEIIEFPVLLLQWRRIPRPTAEGDESTDDASSATDEDESVSEGSGGSEQDEQEFDWRLEVVDEFHSFVRPTWRPRLSTFCTELTGISQADVSRAPDFAELLLLFKSTFIAKHSLFKRENKTCWVTDGPWDLRDFIAKACYINKIDRPSWLSGPVIDLKLLASGYFAAQNKRKSISARGDSPPVQPAPSSLGDPINLSTPSKVNTASVLTTVKAFGPLASPPPSRPSTPLSPQAKPFTCAAPLSPSPPQSVPTTAIRAPSTLSIPALLDALTLEPFIGRQHSGQDDTRNAARIVVELSRREWPLLSNRMVPEGGKGGKERRWGWMRFSGKGVPTGLVDWDRFLTRERARLALQ